MYVPLWAAIAMACSCSLSGQGQGSGGSGSEPPGGDVRELPLPAVPSGLTAPEERADYIIGHFWDGMDFADTLRSHDKLFMEQNFVNYVSLFPHARPEALSPHVGRLLRQARVDTAAYYIVSEIAERYLNDPNSPMRNEDYYIIFLEEQLRLPDLSEAERARPAYQLATASKNRRGSVAADFRYTDRDGRRLTLHGTRAKRLLLLFYDPACPHCTEILDELRGSSIIAGLIADKELAVLAVYTEGDRGLWEDTKASMPEEWTVAIDGSGIVERGLYDLPAMPVIYLLDRDKTVLLKDPTPSELESSLAGE